MPSIQESLVFDDPAPGKVGCLQCKDTRIVVQADSESKYARASFCQCFVLPCRACQGTGFVLKYDTLGREIAARCQECGRISRQIGLYNNAHIPKKYAHSMFRLEDKDAHNGHIFHLLEILLKAYAKRLVTPKLSDALHPNVETGLLVMGPPGTGKTYLMAGFAYQATLYYGVSCVFQPFSELLSQLREGYSQGISDTELIEPHLKAEILIIDDLGKGRNSPWELGVLDMLISERYNRNKLIMATCNYTESEHNTIKERFRKRDETEQIIADTLRERIGERMYSRLKEMCYFETLEGMDRRFLRQEKPHPEDEENPLTTP